MDIEGTVIVNREGTIQIVKFNKPLKKNAIDLEMYVRITKILNDAASDDSISVAVLTGVGDYYSSGNDLTAIKGDYDPLTVLRNFIEAFITFPKLLVAIVNGPAIGVAATTLAHCDLVFASENSYFYTPFTKLSVVAEGCSSFTFPRLIGDRKATEMLLFNYKMTAKEAFERGFVNYLYKPEELQSKAWDKILEVSKLSQSSVTATKRLLKGSIQDKLKQTNELEMEELNKIWYSEEFIQNMLRFAERKNKL